MIKKLKKKKKRNIINVRILSNKKTIYNGHQNQAIYHSKL